MVVVTDRVPRIGEILIQRGSATRVQIELALDRQRESHEPLGEILIAQGHITHDQLHDALMEQFRLQIMAGVISVAIAFGAPFQAIAGQTGSISLRGVVPPVTSVQFSQPTAHIPGDLRIPHTGEIVTITEKSNVPLGYKVSITSETAQKYGAPVLENPQTKETVPYRITYGGKEVTLRNGSGVLTESDRPAINGVEKTLSVLTHPSGQLRSGTFHDVLTMTIIHNR